MKITEFIVPEEEIEKTLKLYDNLIFSKSSMATYNFWKYLYTLFPQIDKSKKWAFVIEGITVKIVEHKNESDVK
jgi:hypothetical protein